MKANMFFANRFKLIKLLGGNLSEVWYAIDTHTEKNDPVALKILTGNNDDLIKEFFYRETESLSILNHHPNIVSIYDSGFDEESQKYWISLEYVQGETLDTRLKKWVGGPDSYTALQIMLEIVEAIATAHSKEIIHRDIKPSNILLDETGSVKVVDFGIAKIKASLQEGMTVRGFGSQPYASPEQIANKEVDFRTDIYSLGVTFFFILTQQQLSTSKNIINEINNSALSANQKDLLLKMVDDNPDNRFPSILHLKRFLLKMLSKEQKTTKLYYARITRKLIESLVNMGLIEYSDELEALSWISNELNTNEVFADQDQNNNWFLFTSKYRFGFIKDNDKECIVLLNISILPSNIMVQNKEWSMPIQATWKLISHRGFPPKDADIQDLFELIVNYKAKQNTKKKKEIQLKKTIIQWENILRLQRKYLLDKNIALRYKSFDISEDGANLEVYLNDSVNVPNLLIGHSLLMPSSKDNKQIPVGTLVSIEGTLLKIALKRDVNIDYIAETGEVSLDDRQVSTALKRQEDALRATRYGEAKNPRLLELIENPHIAEQHVETNYVTNYFHADLDQAKKDAVRAALRSELYLVQGPPGTGKTELISEIVAHLLKRNPDVKILLTSQSNAAVDNALESISKLTPEHQFLRIGREEKIDDKLTKYQLEEVVKLWVEKTKKASENYAVQLETNNKTQLELIAEGSELMQEIKSMLILVKELETELNKLKYEINENLKNEIPDEIKNKSLQKRIKQITERSSNLKQDIISGLDLITELLCLKPENEIRSNILNYQAFIEKELEKKEQTLNNAEKIEIIRKEWLKRLGKGSDFEIICTKESSVVASTCLSVANIPGIWSLTYDWVIVDEAGRATPPEILVPLIYGKNIILVGDHKQLPPVVEYDLTAEDLEEFNISSEILEKSLFEDIYEKADERIKTFLDIQYRMHPGIGRLISECFYDGIIKNDNSTAQLMFDFPMWPGKSVVWISTSNSDERWEKSIKTSKINELEAKLIARICQELEDYLKTKDKKVNVAIISGYAEQKKVLLQLINIKDKNRWKYLDIEIDNVDAFQGRQSDIVIYSVVRSNREGNIGFLKDYRRLNVALSRGRSLLLIVGDHQMVQYASFGEYENYFDKVIDHITKKDLEFCKMEILKNEN